MVAKVEEITTSIETKLSAAEINREKEIQKKLDFVKKEVRYCLAIAGLMAPRPRVAFKL